jgi:hypothetical protein
MRVALFSIHHPEAKLLFQDSRVSMLLYLFRKAVEFSWVGVGGPRWRAAAAVL